MTAKQWLELLQDEYAGETGDESDVDSAIGSDLDDEYGAYHEGEEGDDGGFIRRAFSPGTVSGPKNYVGSNGSNYNGVAYTRDGRGSIDFGAPTAQTAWTNPMSGVTVDLTTGSTSPVKGLLQNGSEVNLKRANRNQHFDIANRIVGNGLAGVSPPGRTWHHLLTRYDMVLVDRTVHAAQATTVAC